jgi:anti-sigma factor RsiW
MKYCERARGWLHPYMDGELIGADQLAFEEHLLECDNCRSEYTAARQVVDAVRGSSPLYPASPTLGLKLRDILQHDRSVRVRRVRVRAGVMAACFIGTILFITLLPNVRTERFTSFAATTHARYAQGAVGLGLSSKEPVIVSEWLRARLPFHLALPNFPLDPGTAKSYSLVGASLMRFEGHDVAFLAYTMNAKPISLLVSSTASVLPYSGQAYTSGKLVFHFSTEHGLKLITWRDRGLSYALVSDVQVEGAQSCVVCHGSESERQKFENLQRRGAPLQ